LTVNTTFTRLIDYICNFENGMLKLISYLKSYIAQIAVIICLLGLQASCDLSLPEYMSHIMNVGIEKSGIENAAPEAISEKQLRQLIKMLDENEIRLISAHYTPVKENERYPEKLQKYLFNSETFVKENIYVLQDNIKADVLTDLNACFEKAIIGNISFQDHRVIGFKIIDFISNEYTTIGISPEKIQTGYILRTGGIMMIIALISMLSVVAVCFIAARLAAGVGRDLRKGLFSKVVGFSNTEFDRFPTATLITRTTNDVQQIQNVLVIMLRMCIYAPVLGIGGVFKVLHTESSMTWIIGVAVVSVLMVVIAMFGIAVPKFKLIQKMTDKLNSVARGSLTGIQVIRAFGRQQYEEKRFDKTNTDLTGINLFVNRTMSLMMPLMSLIMNLTTVAILWYGAKNIQQHAMQVGDVMAFIQYAMQIISSFLMLSMVSIILPRASVSADRIGEILDAEISVKDPEHPMTFDNRQKNGIEFRNVSFKYPGAKDNVLDDVNFISEQGEVTALIGSTGSGKSTLVNLIPRFYDVTEGEILVDERDIRTVKQADLREKIGYVPQKSLLFSGTIESNLKFGGTGIDDERMSKVADIARATEFIESNEEKYSKPVSQGGTNFSGGQQQRLSIARALAKQPDIYIFDDSFSALDYKTDAELRKKLFEEIGEKATVIIVSQRISTIRNADQIIVLDAGKVVGKGKHDELMKTCEVYRQIASSQIPEKEATS